MSGDSIELPPPSDDKSNSDGRASTGQPKVTTALKEPIAEDRKSILACHVPTSVRLSRDYIDYLNVIVVTLAFLAAATAAWESRRLAELTRTAITNADADNKRQAADTQKALALTKQSAEAALRSADVAEAGARAWIAPVTFALRNLADAAEPLTVRVSYQNVGRQPARNISNWDTLDYISSTNSSPVQWAEKSEWQDANRFAAKELCKRIVADKTSDLYPSSIPTLALDVRGNNTVGFDKFPVAGSFAYWVLVTQIKEQHAILIAKGCFVYDTLGKTRHSAFCAFLQPSPGKKIDAWEFNMCPVGNDDF